MEVSLQIQIPNKDIFGSQKIIECYEISGSEK